jgi:hypothetical protein
MSLRSVDEAIARADDFMARMDGAAPAQRLRTRPRGRGTTRISKRLANAAIVLGALVAITIAFGLFIRPIGIDGLFLAAVALLFGLIVVGFWPGAREPKRVAYTDQLPTKAVVQQLDALLTRRRAALPAPAARRADAIGRQLPLLEARLAELNPLDPLAQDARRLIGKHLPDLIDRYERVPADFRHTRDGEGMTVDERLLASLEAAHSALGEIGERLVQQDRDAFETQGRFIESRYKDGGAAGSE